MLRKIKLIIGVFLMLCLFLPLSTCSRPALQFENIQSKEVVYMNYVVSLGEKQVVPYLLAIPFVLPLLLALMGLRKAVPNILAELLDALCGLYVMGLVLAHAWMAKLVVGGYLAATLALACLLAALAGLFQAVSARRKLRQELQG